jgi:hypothetical protein
VSPRRFKRRTYIIVASGRSTLTFSAATSVSSAWTTIRSAFPFTLSPTVNCQDILEPSKVARGGARPITPPARSEDVHLASLHRCWGAAQHHKYRERTGAGSSGIRPPKFCRVGLIRGHPVRWQVVEHHSASSSSTRAVGRHLVWPARTGSLPQLSRSRL